MHRDYIPAPPSKPSPPGRALLQLYSLGNYRCTETTFLLHLPSLLQLDARSSSSTHSAITGAQRLHSCSTSPSLLLLDARSSSSTHSAITGAQRLTFLLHLSSLLLLDARSSSSTHSAIHRCTESTFLLHLSKPSPPGRALLPALLTWQFTLVNTVFELLLSVHRDYIPAPPSKPSPPGRALLPALLTRQFTGAQRLHILLHLSKPSPPGRALLQLYFEAIHRCRDYIPAPPPPAFSSLDARSFYSLGYIQVHRDYIPAPPLQAFSSWMRAPPALLTAIHRCTETTFLLHLPSLLLLDARSFQLYSLGNSQVHRDYIPAPPSKPSPPGRALLPALLTRQFTGAQRLHSCSTFQAFSSWTRAPPALLTRQLQVHRDYIPAPPSKPSPPGRALLPALLTRQFTGAQSRHSCSTFQAFSSWTRAPPALLTRQFTGAQSRHSCSTFQAFSSWTRAPPALLTRQFTGAQRLRYPAPPLKPSPPGPRAPSSSTHSAIHRCSLLTVWELERIHHKSGKKSKSHPHSRYSNSEIEPANLDDDSTIDDSHLSSSIPSRLQPSVLASFKDASKAADVAETLKKRRTIALKPIQDSPRQWESSEKKQI